MGYDEKVDIYGALDATAVSSGFCLGSANWVLRSAREKVLFMRVLENEQKLIYYVSMTTVPPPRRWRT